MNLQATPPVRVRRIVRSARSRRTSPSTARSCTTWCAHPQYVCSVPCRLGVPTEPDPTCARAQVSKKLKDGRKRCSSVGWTQQTEIDLLCEFWSRLANGNPSYRFPFNGFNAKAVYAKLVHMELLLDDPRLAHSLHPLTTSSHYTLSLHPVTTPSRCSPSPTPSTSPTSPSSPCLTPPTRPSSLPVTMLGAPTSGGTRSGRPPENVSTAPPAR